jgi:hypothetical protein
VRTEEERAELVARVERLEAALAEIRAAGFGRELELVGRTLVRLKILRASFLGITTAESFELYRIGRRLAGGS